MLSIYLNEINLVGRESMMEQPGYFVNILKPGATCYHVMHSKEIYQPNSFEGNVVVKAELHNSGEKHTF